MTKSGTILSTIDIMEKMNLLHISKEATKDLVKDPLKNVSTNMERTPSFDQDTVCFETCLRKIYFFTAELSTEEKASLAIDYELRQGQEALQFLLELLCGLKSKVLGETEIFGQFKRFLETPEAQSSFFQNKELTRFIFETVKSAREKHINRWGVQSYGSLIRKLIKSYPEVSLIGYGHLAEELQPWLKHKKVMVHVRSINKIPPEFEGTKVPLESSAEFSPVVIVAAPVSSEFLQELAPRVKLIIDCRALPSKTESLRDRVNCQLIELEELFRQLAGEQSRVQAKIPAVEGWISEQVEKFFLRCSHRPQGWDDLCA